MVEYEYVQQGNLYQVTFVDSHYPLIKASLFVGEHVLSLCSYSLSLLTPEEVTAFSFVMGDAVLAYENIQQNRARGHSIERCLEHIRDIYRVNAAGEN